MFHDVRERLGDDEVRSERGRFWEAFWDSAAHGHRAMALDFRGHGGSGHTQGGYGLDDYVGDAVTLLEAIGEPTVLVGNGLGACVARVLAHPQGGRKGVPAGARVVVLINKVDSLRDRAPARETAECLLRESAIHSVVLAAVRGEEPVLEVCGR